MRSKSHDRFSRRRQQHPSVQKIGVLSKVSWCLQECITAAIPSDSEGSKNAEQRQDDGEEDDGKGEDESGADDDVDWEELFACPLTVRFTQEKVDSFSYQRGPIVITRKG